MEKAWTWMFRGSWRRWAPGGLVLLLAGGLGVRGSAEAAAAGWLSFRGDAALTGVAGSALPEEPAPVWSFETGGGIESTAAIAGGVAYVGSLDGHLYALDLAGGRLRWKYAAGDEIKSSPAVAAGVVYFGDEAGRFHAVDAATGEARWTFQAAAAVTSPPNLADLAGGRAVLFGSYDNHLYALAAQDGSLLWKLETDSYLHASPAVAGGFAYAAGCDGYLRKVRLADGAEVGKVSLEGYAAASPALAGRAFVGTFENQVLAVDLEKMEVLWRFSDPQRQFPFYASAAVTPGAVVVAGRDKRVRALEPATGEERWSFAARARIDASPVVVGERVIAASTRGELVALDLATGELLWQYDLAAPVTASPAVGEGHLVLGTGDGLLVAFGEKR